MYVGNYLTDNYAVEWGIGIFDSNGQMNGLVWSGGTDLIEAGKWSGISGTTDSGVFAHLNDGYYQLKLVSRAKGSDEWLLCHNADNHSMTLWVNGNKVLVGSPTISLSLTEARLMGSGLTTETQYLVASIKNNTAQPFRDILYVYIDGVLTKIGVSIEGNETVDVYIPFVSATEGEKNFSMYADKDKSVMVGEANVNIEKKPEVVYSNALDLKLLFEVEDLKSSIDGDYIVGNKLHAKVTVTNDNDMAYRGYVYLYLYHWVGNSGNGVAHGKPVELAAGESVDVEFEYDIEYGERYSLVAAWTKENAITPYDEMATVYKFFTVKDKADPDPGPDTSIHDLSISANSKCFDLLGRQIVNQNTMNRTSNKGLSIVRESNGRVKKIIRR
jgi:hypothetical protein